jgi:hypothetical protein
LIWAERGIDMVDRNLQNFYGRIGRIQNIHDSGGGFEANGTLGMSYYNAQRRRTRRRFGILAPLAVVAAVIVGVKSTVHATIGAELYNQRVAALRAGDSVEKAGAYVLQADPVTIAIADKIRQLLY